MQKNTPKRVTNEDLAIAIAKGFEEVDEQFVGVRVDLGSIKKRLDTVEMKIDRTLYKDNVNLERRVKNLENKVRIKAE